MEPPIELKESGFLRVKFAGNAEDGTFEGYGSVYGNVDSHGQMVMPGAFKDTIAAHKAAGTSPVMLWMHKMDIPIGRWTEFSEDDFGLFVRGQINMKTTAGREAYALIMDGDVSGLSIGYLVPPGGSTKKAGVVQLTAVKLVEVSVVSVPSNDLTRIRLDSKSDLVQLLTKSGGLQKDVAKRIAHGGFDAIHRQPSDKASLIKAVEASTLRYRNL